MTTAAVRTVLNRAFDDEAAMRATWPGWAWYVASLMGKLGAYVVMYRNQDLRAYWEARSSGFAAYCRERDLEAQFEEQERRLATTEDDDAALVRYCRCSNCGAVNIDPVIRVSDEVPV